MTPAFFVVACPLVGCHWKSDPLANEVSAVEALRAHVNGHGHSDLVDFAITGIKAERYQREGGEK